MKTILALLFLGLISSSLAFHSVMTPRPFIIDSAFLDVPRLGVKPSFSHINALIQQGFRDSSKIHDFIKGLQERLNEEHLASLGIVEQQRTECADEETARTAAIAEGKEAAGKSQAQLSLCASEQAEAENLRTLAESALQIYGKELPELEAARLLQIDEYNSRRQKLVDVQAAIDKTLEYLNEVEAESAGLQPQLVQMTNTLLQSTIKTGHSHMVLPVYTRLLQMHAHNDFNAATLQEVRLLLDQLRGNSVNSVSALDANEAENQAKYDADHKRLEDLVAKLNKQVDASNDYVTAMTSCQEQENGILKLANDKVTRNDDLLQQARKLCQLTEDEFTAGELARTRQTSLLHALDAAVTKLENDYEGSTTQLAGDIITLKLL